jgi:hypothetical protein
MPEDGVAMRPEETRDLVGIGTADHDELDRSIHNGKELGNFGSGGAGVNLDARVAPTPALHPSVQLVTWYVTRLFLRHSESEDRCMA